MTAPDLRRPCPCARVDTVGPHWHSLQEGCPREPVEPEVEQAVSTDERGQSGEHDLVSHPSHYRSSPAKCRGCGQPIECIDVTQHMNFPVGNATKYLWRLDHKGDPIEQLRKARQYIDFEIERRERERVTAPPEQPAAAPERPVCDSTTSLWGKTRACVKDAGHEPPHHNGHGVSWMPGRTKAGA